jgi:hypothetical protein
MLIFPENFVLSNKHYSQNSEEDFGLIDRIELPMSTSFTLGGKNIETNNVHVIWKVTVLDSKERRLVKKETPKKDTIETLAQRWAQMRVDANAMNTGNDDDDDDSE